MRLLNPIMRFLLGLIIRYLPDKDKRTFCLASLFYYLTEKEFYKGSSISRDNFNELLKVSEDKDMLELPRVTSNLVWGDTQIPEHLSNEMLCSAGQCPSYEDAKKLAEQFIEATPRWLRYKHEDMVSDLMKQIYLVRPA